MRRTSRVSILTAALVAVGLSGCATQPEVKPAEPAPDPFAVKLAEYAESASLSIRRLAEVEAQTKVSSRGVDLAKSGASVAVERKSGQPAGLDKVVELHWSGPIEDAVRKIADESGYLYVVRGKKPALPILVSIATTRATLFEALQDIGFQAGPAAIVHVRPSAKTIELRYPGA